MTELAVAVLAVSVGLVLYAYLGYPAVLWALAAVRRKGIEAPDPDWTPTVSISVPAYNEEAQIDDLIRSLLALDYPRDKVQILVVSDASSDATDEIVARYADQGVELLRMPERGGKNKAENAAAAHLRGEIVVNTDASIRIAPNALRRLIAVFKDPAIGVASGRDVSVDPGEAEANVGEAGYVGYEMGIRDMETKVNGIIGSSGCFYAIRPELHRLPLPDNLSRDFSSALHAQENGFRAVSVPEATCLVPRGTSLVKEYRRKVRTITRGMQTLWFKRHLLNPFRHGYFAWMLWSHKLARWALPWFAGASLVALGVLAPVHPVFLGLFTMSVLALVLAAVGWRQAHRNALPRFLAVPTFLVMGNLAAAHALVRAVRGGGDRLWEPTRRNVVRAAGSDAPPPPTADGPWSPGEGPPV